MPSKLRMGSVGPEVKILQEALNQMLPGVLPPLVVDGVFGPKTYARVKQFQSMRGLAVDGVVGPNTWGQLSGGGGGEAPSQAATERSFHCGFGDGAAPPGEGLIQSMFHASLAAGQIEYVQNNVPPPPPGKSGSGPIRMLTPAQRGVAQKAFGNSLDFSTIFISDSAGLGGRPWTVAIWDGTQYVQIMCCGTFSPDEATLVHELAHAWQSQHHSNKRAYMINAGASQADAVKKNALEALNDSIVLLHKDYPVQWPFSAYAYVPGMPWGAYAAEQQASAVEHDATGARSHVQSVPRNAVDPATVNALKYVNTADRRKKGVAY